VTASTVLASAARLPALLARGLIRAYQLSFSMLVGRGCRHLPTCSAYMDEAIARHGLWAGGWVGLARLCRCHPLGTSGLDFVCERVPETSRWYLPWRYGRWRGTDPGPEPQGSLLEGIVPPKVSSR
jgi:putative membrane protein insertion efficiency factor